MSFGGITNIEIEITDFNLFKFASLVLRVLIDSLSISDILIYEIIHLLSMKPLKNFLPK